MHFPEAFFRPKKTSFFFVGWSVKGMGRGGSGVPVQPPGFWIPDLGAGSVERCILPETSFYRVRRGVGPVDLF